MKPWLMTGLASTLAATAGVALWSPDAATDLPVAAPAARPGMRTAVDLPRTTPASVGAASVAQSSVPLPAGLPTRPADWPAPPGTALVAWQGAPVPPPPAAPAAAVPAASTPAPGPVFPYRWIGQLDDGGARQVLLASAQRTVAVRLGAVLDDRWRLQAAADGALMAQPLADGSPVPVPGAPAPASAVAAARPQP